MLLDILVASAALLAAVAAADKIAAKWNRDDARRRREDRPDWRWKDPVGPYSPAVFAHRLGYDKPPPEGVYDHQQGGYVRR